MKILAYFMLYGILGMIAALIIYTFAFELAKLIVYKAIGGEFVSFVFLFFNIKKENGKIAFKSTNPQLLAKCTITPPEGLSEEQDWLPWPDRVQRDEAAGDLVFDTGAMRMVPLACVDAEAYHVYFRNCQSDESGI